MEVSRKIKIIRREQQRINDLLKAQKERIEDFVNDANYHPNIFQKTIGAGIAKDLENAAEYAEYCMQRVEMLKDTIKEGR